MSYELDRRRFLQLSGFGTAGLVAAACAPDAMPAPAPTPKPAVTPDDPDEPEVRILATEDDEVATIRHGIVVPRFNAAFQMYANRRGHWEDEKIEVDFIEQTTDTLLIRSLIAGELDTIEITPATTIAAMIEGADVKLIGGYQLGLVHALAVQPDIESLEDLEGRRVAITGVGALPDTLLKAILLKNDLLHLYDTMEIQSAPGLPATVQQLLADQADAAAAVSVDYFPELEEHGVRLLLEYAEELPEFLRFTLITTEETFQRRQNELARWFVGYGKAIRDFIEMREDAIEFAMEVAGMEEPVAALNYDYYIERRLFQPNGYIDPQAIEDFQVLNHGIGNQPEILPVDRIVDYTLQRQLVEVLGPYPGFDYAT